MGTAIRATSVSAEVIADAEKELSMHVEGLNHLRQTIVDAAKHYLASEKSVSHLEIELAKSQQEVLSNLFMCHDCSHVVLDYQFNEDQFCLRLTV